MFLDPTAPHTSKSDDGSQKSIFPLRGKHVQDKPLSISELASSALVLNKAGTYDVSIPENIQEHPHVGSFVILIVKKVIEQLPSSEDMISAVRSMISEESLIALDKKFPGAIDSAVNGWLLTKNTNGISARAGDLLRLYK